MVRDGANAPPHHEDFACVLGAAAPKAKGCAYFISASRAA
jgi:hypothetical protein